MSKTVIVGITSSGKTCYFYGMMNKMMKGCLGFSIRVAQKDFSNLRRGIKRLGDISLPLEERFPPASSMLETYEMDLLYNLKRIDSFNWVDYPGELAEESTSEFVDLLDGADCLLLCVDGMAFQGTEDDIENIVDSIYYDKGGLELCNALQQAEAKYEDGFPPVCIMVTKYDEVSPELRKSEIMTDIIQKSFPLLFNENTMAVGKHRIVTICPVSLGKEIGEGGRLDPKNVEKPICFANFLIQMNAVAEMERQADEYIALKQREQETYQKKGFLRKLVSSKPETLTEEQKQAINDLVRNGKKNLDALKGMIENLPLFIDGEQTDWP